MKKSLDGIWELESQENMDEFFQEMGKSYQKYNLGFFYCFTKRSIYIVFKIEGVNYFMRQIAIFVKPVIKLVDNGETWTMSVSGTPNAIPDVTFKDKVEFIEDCMKKKEFLNLITFF